LEYRIEVAALHAESGEINQDIGETYPSEYITVILKRVDLYRLIVVAWSKLYRVD
jgi:hypothetical protein